MSEENTGTAAETSEPNDQNQNQATDHMIPKARFDAVNAKKNEAVATLESIANELAEDVPEEFRALIPAALPAADRIKWMRDASKSGLFNPPASQSSPDSKRPASKKAEDFSTMTPFDMRKAGYGK